MLIFDKKLKFSPLYFFLRVAPKIKFIGLSEGSKIQWIFGESSNAERKIYSRKMNIAQWVTQFITQKKERFLREESENISTGNRGGTHLQAFRPSEKKSKSKLHHYGALQEATPPSNIGQDIGGIFCQEQSR